MTSSLSTVAYIGATILFILCLGGLSNPETSRRGNLYGIIGMAIAVLATVFGPQVTARRTALHPRRDGDRRRRGSLRGARRQDDADARARRADAQPRGPCRDARRLRQFHRSGRVGRHDARRAGDPRDRDVPRRADRRRDVLGLGDRLRQALRQDHRQAGPAAREASAESRGPHRRHLLRLCVRQRAHRGRGDDADDRHDRRRAALRRPHGHGHRRRRHAGRGVDAEQLLGLGGGGDRLHALQRPPDRRRRAGRLERRDPVLHHVPGDEPQLHQRDRRRLRHRQRCPGRRGGRRSRRAR